MQQALLDELLSGNWQFHGWAEDVFLDYHSAVDVLRFLASTIRPGDQTLETGTGYSTIVFALAGAKHTAISPFPFEHDRIRQWCNERNIPLDDVTMVNGPSQDILPRLDGDLDLVLVDGDHAFPTPLIDFYYACRRLRAGGRLVVDDIHIRTGYLLNEFLSTEKKRWRLEKRFPQTTIFVKLNGDDLIDPAGWIGQPFCSVARPIPGVASLAERLRFHLRIRTRLRNLQEGSSGSWPIGKDR